MDAASVEVMGSGYLVFLAKPQPLLFSDFSRLPKGISYAQAQVYFYLFSVNTCEAMQTEGLTCVHIISSRPRPLVMPAGDLYMKLFQALPFRVKRNIVARVYEPGRERLLEYRGFEQERVASIHRRAVGSYDVLGIGGNSQKETLELLGQSGLCREFLPVEYGGNLDLSQVFSSWMRQRLTVEGMSARPLLLTGGAAPVAPASPSSSMSSQTLSTSSSSSEKPNVASLLVERMPNESLESFRKRRNAVYGRRSVEKERRRIEKMDEHRQKLLDKKQALLCENVRLQHLLEQARKLIPQQNENNNNNSLLSLPWAYP